jgi:23S rRNA (guanosine2251-2'-O)-methyltransferase
MTEWIVGKNPVFEALVAKQHANQLLVAEGAHAGKAEALARQSGIPIKSVPRRKIDAISGSQRHQGVALQVAAHAYVDLWEYLAELPPEPLLLLLDGIEDPHNLGAILRSADAFGVDLVVIPKRHACGLTQTVARTSAGASAHMPVARVTNMAETVRKLKKKDVWIWGSDAKGDGTPRQMNLQRPLALIIGSEGKGLGPQLRKLCDGIFSLPMHGKVNSLNASVATGILLHEVSSSFPDV